MSEADEESDFSQEKKKLFQLLLAYCVGVSICRLMGSGMRFISLLDWMIFRQSVLAGSAFAAIQKFPLQRLPWVLMPFAGLLCLQQGKWSRAGLFFVGGMSAVGVVNHIGGLFVYLYYGVFQGAFVPPSLRVIVALLLGVAFSGLSRRMFQLTQSLYSQEKEAKDACVRGIALLVLVFCLVAPFLSYGEIAKSVGRLINPYENVKLLKPGVEIYFIDGSPDGKLLAIGAKDGVSVWDAESRQCVWSDDNVAPAQRVRFSPGGRYLAAAGRGAPEGASDLAVFEVEGFRRLPGFNWPEEDLQKKRTFHDLAFRPDEKSLLAAWHRDWDWDQVPGGFIGKAAVAIRVQEIEEALKKNPSLQDRDLPFFCTELDMVSGEVRSTKAIRDLAQNYDLLDGGGIYFSPDASYLIYPRWYNRNNYVARHRVYRVDTNTWTEDEIWLDVKYSMFTPRGGDWYEWKFTRDGKTAYLLGKENGSGFVVLELDMTTKQTKELQRVRVTRSFERPPWNRIALSPDEKRAVLLGLGETLYDYGRPETRMVSLRIWDLRTNTTKRFAYKHDGKQSSAMRIVWLSRKTLAISMSTRAGFFFIDIEEGEQ